MRDLNTGDLVDLHIKGAVFIKNDGGRTFLCIDRAAVGADVYVSFPTGDPAVTIERAAVQARDLSCQGLQMVDPDQPFHGGVPVEGYPEEMARRGEDHVYRCERLGHRAVEGVPGDA